MRRKSRPSYDTSTQANNKTTSKNVQLRKPAWWWRSDYTWLQQGEIMAGGSVGTATSAKKPLNMFCHVRHRTGWILMWKRYQMYHGWEEHAKCIHTLKNNTNSNHFCNDNKQHDNHNKKQKQNKKTPTSTNTNNNDLKDNNNDNNNNLARGLNNSSCLNETLYFMKYLVYI